jgi:hypothetical protein
MDYLFIFSHNIDLLKVKINNIKVDLIKKTSIYN